MDTKTLAGRAGLLLPSLTRIIATLRKKGLLTQTRDTADRRRQMIAITANGARVIADRAAQAAQIADGFKARLGASDYERLLDLLEKLDPETSKEDV